MQKFYRKVKY